MASNMNGIEVIDIWSDDEDDGSSPVIAYNSIKSSMKGKNNKKRLVINDDDCSVLESNPFEESVDKFSTNEAAKESQEELTVIAEVGQVACRDYPHSRHLCVIFPFNTTPHASYCQQCYCYVCDSVAPCKFWGAPVGHCHATALEQKWRILREHRKHGFFKDRRRS
ncbi:uncharacterized protein LOC113340362 [Papaver somniferum]|uniref:uncharacterized protein LOC113340362 n=1 Tax=Papaver somniferum TaxID=3469 RepID=UPI000E6F98E6|nr:uncharacterized protein LOC113340362 [Papaver somniferum]